MRCKRWIWFLIMWSGLISITSCKPSYHHNSSPRDDVNSQKQDQREWPKHTNERTSFQVASPWKPEYDVRSDVAMVYGITPSFEERVASWRGRGYRVHFMTGISWGNYGEYFTGKFDGKTHYEDSQRDRYGNIIWHSGKIPYVVPSASYLDYIKSLVKRAVDAGVSAIHLEEPELWARAGYSDTFKKKWEDFYKTPWKAQHKSPEATYMSSKLKSKIYVDALKEVLAYAKEYSRSKGEEVKCYVATHSLLSYSAIDMVSPMADLAQLPDMDGYIAQIWTGTARVPVWYNGSLGERVFENAFLEYGSMASMTAPTGLKVFFLTDPAEDSRRTWDDYKRNYQATFVAQLMFPQVADYEVMPWPDRVFLGKFSLENDTEPQSIPPEYATQVQVMVNTLNDMPLSTNRVTGSKGVGVLISNSLMFQRFPSHQGYEDPQLANYYGLALPLVKRGVPVENVFMENLNLENTLKDIDVLVMSYASIKPLNKQYHEYLTKWVQGGGKLLYVGRDQDPFQTVTEWWNTRMNKYVAPADHLFEMLGIQAGTGNSQGFEVGKGYVYVLRHDPKEFVQTVAGDQDYWRQISQIYQKKGKELTFKNSFYLERGPYDIAAVLSESVSDKPLELNGPFIDLFNPQLPIVGKQVIYPGEQAFLFNLSRRPQTNKPQVLASSVRVYRETIGSSAYSFEAIGPTKAVARLRIYLPKAPNTIEVQAITDGRQLTVEHSWDKVSGTCLLSFESTAGGSQVVVSW